MVLTLAVHAIASGGCGTGAGDDGRCGAAEGHVVACLGALPPGLFDECDAAAADEILALDCEALRQAAGGNRAGGSGYAIGTCAMPLGR